MLETKDIRFQYPESEPLFFPDLSVDAGQPLLIFGESGSGKTTLLHLLAGLRQPASGAVFIEKDNISNFSAAQLDQFRGQHIGIVYQQSYFIESLSVWDNLMLSPYAASASKAEAIAERLNIKAVLSRFPHQLSVGQQQRASIARAVMNKPKLLLADEPTSALDNHNCSQVIDLLLEEAYTNNAALIIVTHDDRLKTEISQSIELNALTE
ncbi:MAG: ATP-binding cassette domain-containing protein [Bacteroidota bacterium]